MAARRLQPLLQQLLGQCAQSRRQAAADEITAIFALQLQGSRPLGEGSVLGAHAVQARELASASSSTALRRSMSGASASTSGRDTAAPSFSLSASMGQQLVLQRAKHSYNLVKPVDTNQINLDLAKATLLEHAALVIAQNGQHFDPAQTSATLRRLPMMVWAQNGRLFRDVKADVVGQQWKLLHNLMAALGLRFATVLPDCTDKQLAIGLWGYAAARCQVPPVLVDSACAQLRARMSSMALPELATCTWALAETSGAAQRQAVQGLLREVAARVAALPPPGTPLSPPATPATANAAAPSAASKSPSTYARSTAFKSNAPAPSRAGPSAPGSSSSSSSAAAAASRSAPPPADAAASSAAAAPLDHRSVVKLARAFAVGGVKAAAALDALAAHAAAQVGGQLAAHESEAAQAAAQGLQGPRRMAPRTTYRYRSVQGWLDLNKPLAPRASKYLRDSETRPRVLLRDYTLPTLASLLASYAALGHRPEQLLPLLARHVAAAAPQRVPPGHALRLVGACSRLGHRSPELMSALLGGCPLAQLPAKQLVALADAAAGHGVRSELLYRRLLRAATARMQLQLQGEPATALALATPFASDSAAAAGASGSGSGSSKLDVLSGGEAVRLLATCVRAGVRDAHTLALLCTRLAQLAPKLSPDEAAAAALAASRVCTQLAQARRPSAPPAAATSTASDATTGAPGAAEAASPAAAAQMAACRPLIERAADLVSKKSILGEALPRGVPGRVAVAMLSWPGQPLSPSTTGLVVGALKAEQLTAAQKDAIAKAYAARGAKLPPNLQGLSLGSA